MLQPEVPFVVGLTDEPEGCFDPAREPFEVVELARMPFAGNAECASATASRS